MPAPTPFIDFAELDLTKVVVDQAKIYEVLPHRFELQMLTAIVYMNTTDHVVVGYKDTTPDDFWCRGHFPGNPIMPGVLMCEAAAQLSAYYSLELKINENVLMGLGGIEETRFRRGVRPGERLTLMAKGLRVRPRMTQFAVQGYVGTELAVETTVLGIVLAKTGG